MLEKVIYIKIKYTYNKIVQLASPTNLSVSVTTEDGSRLIKIISNNNILKNSETTVVLL